MPGGGELVRGQGGKTIDGHPTAVVRVPLDRNINAHLARRRLRLWGGQQQEQSAADQPACQELRPATPDRRENRRHPFQSRPLAACKDY